MTSECTVESQSQNFRGVDASLADAEGCGRDSVANNKKFQVLIEANPHNTVQELAAALRIYFKHVSKH